MIAFRGGRWRNALLLLVIVPFFVTYLIRTLSWETILSDSGIVVSTLKTIGIVSEDGRLLDTTVSVVAGITYNFLPFMILPLYASLERIDPRHAGGGLRPLRAAPRRVPARDAAALDAGRRGGRRCSRSSRRPGDFINAAAARHAASSS